MPLCSRYRYRSEHRCCIWYLFFYFTHHRIANVYLAKIIIYSQTTRCGQCEEVTCSSDSHWSLFIYSSFLFPWRTRAYMIIRWIYNSIWWCVLYITVAKKKNISFIMASWAGSIEQTKKTWRSNAAWLAIAQTKPFLMKKLSIVPASAINCGSAP